MVVERPADKEGRGYTPTPPQYTPRSLLPNFVLLELVEEVTLERPAASAAGGEHESEPPKATLEYLVRSNFGGAFAVRRAILANGDGTGRLGLA